jgi:predicted signal transduction protein with EAL and GGDEF domain
MLRPHDRIAVIGPAELIVVLSNLPSPEYAELGVARLMSEYEEPLLFGAAPAKVRPTVGIAIGAPEMPRPGDLIRQARAAAREAITAGSGYVVHQALDDALAGETLEPALRAAIAANELHLVFQPQVNLASGDPVAIEALARWDRAPQRVVPPDVFIPLAERCGLLPSRCRIAAGVPQTNAVRLTATSLTQQQHSRAEALRRQWNAFWIKFCAIPRPAAARMRQNEALAKQKPCLHLSQRPCPICIASSARRGRFLAASCATGARPMAG